MVLSNRAHLQRWEDEQYTERAKQFVNGCQDKKTYPSKRVAMGVKRVMLANSPNYDEWERIETTLFPYHCRCCKKWHLGGNHKKKTEGQ